MSEVKDPRAVCDGFDPNEPYPEHDGPLRKYRVTMPRFGSTGEMTYEFNYCDTCADADRKRGFKVEEIGE